MANRNAQYSITPQMHALMRLQKLADAKAKRDAHEAESHRLAQARADAFFLHRHGLTREDPRLPLVIRALEAAAIKGMDVRDLEVSHKIAVKALAGYERVLNREQTDVIYYIRCGEFIKIGTTSNLKRRLRAYPPDAEVLATEPGSFQRETERVEEFSEYLAGRREWFTPGAKLLAHIERLRDSALDNCDAG